MVWLPVRTSIESFVSVKASPKHDRRSGRTPCKGRLDVKMISKGEIHWMYPVCGDEGIVSGWKDLFWESLVLIQRELLNVAIFRAFP